MKLEWYRRIDPRCSGFFNSADRFAYGIFGHWDISEFFARFSQTSEKRFRHHNQAIEWLEQGKTQPILLVSFPRDGVKLNSREDR